MKAAPPPSSADKNGRRTYIVARAFQLRHTLRLVGTAPPADAKAAEA